MNARARDIIELKPAAAAEPLAQHQEEPAAEFAAHRDVLRPQERAPETDETKTRREEAKAIIEQQCAMVDEAIAKCERSNHEGELDTQIDMLQSVRRLLDSELATAAYGSAQMLAAITGSLTRLTDAARNVTANTLTEATHQAGVLMAEITIEHIHEMDIVEAAERFTGQHFAQMSNAQLDAIGRKVDAFTADANRFGEQAHQTLEATGLASPEYGQTADQLAKEKEKAREQENRREELRILYLEFINREAEFQRLGMTDEAAAEQAHRQEVLSAAELAAKEEATRKARAEGKSEKEVAAAAEAAGTETVQAIINDGVALADKRGLTDVQERRAEVTRAVVVEQSSEAVMSAQSVDTNATSTNSLFSSASADVFAGFSASAPEQPALAFPPEVVASGRQFAASGQPTGGAVLDESQPEEGEEVAPKTVAVATPEKSEPTRTPNG